MLVLKKDMRWHEIGYSKGVEGKKIEQDQDGKSSCKTKVLKRYLVQIKTKQHKTDMGKYGQWRRIKLPNPSPSKNLMVDL